MPSATRSAIAPLSSEKPPDELSAESFKSPNDLSKSSAADSASDKNSRCSSRSGDNVSISVAVFLLQAVFPARSQLLHIYL